MDTDIDMLTKRVLVHGLDDWVSLFEAASLTEKEVGAGDEDKVRQRAITVIRQLLADGLIQIGKLHEGQFVPSSTPEAVAAQADKDWKNAEGPEVVRDSPIWICNTEKGDELARMFADEIYAEEDDENE